MNQKREKKYAVQCLSRTKSGRRSTMAKRQKIRQQNGSSKRHKVSDHNAQTNSSTFSTKLISCLSYFPSGKKKKEKKVGPHISPSCLLISVRAYTQTIIIIIIIIIILKKKKKKGHPLLISFSSSSIANNNSLHFAINRKKKSIRILFFVYLTVGISLFAAKRVRVYKQNIPCGSRVFFFFFSC